jgi:hypothetical protein
MSSEPGSVIAGTGLTGNDAFDAGAASVRAPELLAAEVADCRSPGQYGSDVG